MGRTLRDKEDGQGRAQSRPPGPGEGRRKLRNMKTNKMNKSTSEKKSAAKAEITRWWALADLVCDDSFTVAVRLRDGRRGFLNVSLSRAFDGTPNWCTLEAAGNGATACYTAGQVVLPAGLRRHIARKALANEAESLFDTLDEELIEEEPRFGAYLAARCLLGGQISAGNLEELEMRISDSGAAGCTEESDIRNIKRLVRECRKYLNVAEDGSDLQSACGQE